MPDRAKGSGSQDAKVQTIRGRPANLDYLILYGRHEVSIFFSISNIFSTSRKPFLRPV